MLVSFSGRLWPAGVLASQTKMPWARCDCDHRRCLDPYRHLGREHCARPASRTFVVSRGRKTLRLGAKCRAVYVSEMGYAVRSVNWRD